MANTPLKDITTAGTIGTLKYNSLAFSPMRHVQVSSEPVYDDAGRAVIYVKHTVTVTAIVSNTTEADGSTEMLDIREKLTAPGKELVMTGLGFGDTTVNGTATGKVDDVAWGPKPRVISMEPAGGLLSWEVVWTCEFNIPECDVSSDSSRPMAMNYGTTYSINGCGITTRTIEGYAQIPLTRPQTGNANRVPTNVDAQWDRIVITIPKGFKRVNNSRKISLDKSRLDFSVTDQELEGPAFPPGIAEAKLRLRMDSQDIGFARWTATFTGNYKVAKGHPTCRAAEAFYGDAFNQLTRLSQGFGRHGGVVIPSGISFEESPYDRTSSFTMRLNVTGNVTDFLGASGFWRPLAQADYGRWRQSMNTIFGRRGFAGLVYNHNEDAIVDLCLGASRLNIGTERSNARESEARCHRLFGCENITEENSWLRYENEVHTIHKVDYVLHKPIGTAGRTRAIIQLTARADDYIVMTGKALRIKFKPDIPELRAVRGVRVFELEREVKPAQLVASIFGCPVYRAFWRIVYVAEDVLDAPAGVPPDPILGV